MSEKVDQHVLPKVYLKAFVDASTPDGHPANRPFEPRLWLLSPHRDSQAKSRSPKKSFRANRFYNLRADHDLSRPLIEDALGRIEDAYGKVLPLVENGLELDATQYGTVLVFLGSLRSRHPDHLAHWQRQIEEVEGMHRSAERAHTGKEEVSDRLFWMKDEAAKRMIPDQTLAYGRVVGRYGWFLRNHAAIPFVTSDQPLIHIFLHADEIATLGFPVAQIPKDATHAHQAFFSYCALTPRLAFVASPLLLPPRKSLYEDTDDVTLVAMLNNLVRQRAAEYLISHVQEPFGQFAPLLREVVQFSDQLLAAQCTDAIAFYTAADRYYVRCTSVRIEVGDGPFEHRIIFIPATLEPILEVKAGDRIRQIHAFESSGGELFIRGARVAVSSDVIGAEWIVEADAVAAL